MLWVGNEEEGLPIAWPGKEYCHLNEKAEYTLSTKKLQTGKTREKMVENSEFK